MHLAKDKMNDTSLQTKNRGKEGSEEDEYAYAKPVNSKDSGDQPV